MKRASAIPAAILFLTVVFGCAQNVALVPAPDAQRLSDNDAAASVRGIEVTANGNSWPGREDITTEVTPVRVTIRNRSGVPVRINYGSFALVDPEGNRLAALSPSAIEGSIAGYVQPDFPARGYYGSPFYSPFYPGFGPSYWGEPFFYDPMYYNRYYGYRREIELPTPEMLERALAEGVLEDGGETAGFLYFKRVDPDIAQVTFKADLIDARTDQAFAEIAIPFTVVEG